MPTQIKKLKNFENPIVVVNGFAGTGKTCIVNLLRHLDGIEPPVYSPEFEWFCQLWASRNISDHMACELIRAKTDLLSYNLCHGREINWRLSDISSVSNHPNCIKYFLRGLKKDVDDSRINAHFTAFLVTHNLLPFIEIVDSALHSRLSFIEVLRDPLYMLNQSIYNQKHLFDSSSSARAASFVYSHTGKQIFEGDTPSEPDSMWKEGTYNFYAANAIRCLEKMISHLLKMPINYTDINCLPIFFEDFVVDPHPTLHDIEHLTALTFTSSVRKALKKEKIPRVQHDDGKANHIYKKVGWKRIKTNSDHLSDFDRFQLLYRDQGLDDFLLDKLVDLSTSYRKWKSTYKATQSEV